MDDDELSNLDIDVILEKFKFEMLQCYDDENGRDGSLVCEPFF